MMKITSDWIFLYICKCFVEGSLLKYVLIYLVLFSLSNYGEHNPRRAGMVGCDIGPHRLYGGMVLWQEEWREADSFQEQEQIISKVSYLG